MLKKKIPLTRLHLDIVEEKRQKRKEQQQMQAQQQQPATPGASNLRPIAPPNMTASVPRPIGAVQPSLRSHSPGMGQLGLAGMGMQQNRMQFNQQAQQLQAQQVQAQQQGMMGGPSPNGQAASSMVGPFGQPQMSQANLTTTTASVTTSQFPTSNGTAGLSNSSPIHQQNQFNDIMKARLAQVSI